MFLKREPDSTTNNSGRKKTHLFNRKKPWAEPGLYAGALPQKAGWVKEEEEEGRQKRGGRTERGEEQCEHVKLSELQIELRLNPQVAVDKQ